MLTGKDKRNISPQKKKWEQQADRIEQKKIISLKEENSWKCAGGECPRGP